MRKFVFIAAWLGLVLCCHAQQFTKKDVKKVTTGFISAVKAGQLGGSLYFFDPRYVAEQHDDFLEGRTDQFVEEFLSGNDEEGVTFITPKWDHIKSMKVKKTFCDVERDDIYADVQVVMDDGVKYVVRLRLRVTDSGDLRFIGAVG